MVKNIVARTYRPLLAKYLSRLRVYYYDDTRLEIPPGVFHPGFFFSTRLLLRYMLSLPVLGKKFLELGAGSGLISISAAKQGARVTATDINPLAVEYLHKNSIRNNVRINVIESDLFDAVPVQIFDIIAINPPYYKRNPATLADRAWYCGENGEYYQQLFKQLGNYSHPGSHLLMVLSDACDLGMIDSFARSHGFYLQKMISKKNLWEHHVIYQVARLS